MKKNQKYYVEGMHCRSCEILLEQKIRKLTNSIRNVTASTKNKEVNIECSNNCQISEKTLNELFSKEGYVFSNTFISNQKISLEKILIPSLLAVIFFMLFILIGRQDFIGISNVNKSSSLLTFFIFGVIASLTSCSALVGGIILTFSKNWKVKDHFIFHIGRLISFIILGAILGFIGGKIQLNLTFNAILVLIVSTIMILLGLSMMGFDKLPQISIPKYFGSFIFEKKLNSLLIGFLTFFLPCGFTLTAQSMAMISGSPVKASLTLLFFALGTLPVLSLISLSGDLMFRKNGLSDFFSIFAGVLIIFFAAFNINSQLNVLNLPSLNNIEKKTNTENNETAPIKSGIQVIKMTASSQGYNPNYFKVKVNIPARWEIEDIGTSGCTNAVIAKDLFPDPVKLTKGTTSIKEFTPTKIGQFKFSCWMGMITGIIEVVN